MKIRIDFITNSSSSSFMCFGNEVDFKDIDLSNGKYFVCGKELYEGQDVFELDEEIYEYLKGEIIAAKLTNKFENSKLEYLSFYEYYMFFNNSYKGTSINEMMKHIDINKKFFVIEFDKDYCSSKDIETIKERYINY